MINSLMALRTINSKNAKRNNVDHSQSRRSGIESSEDGSSSSDHLELVEINNYWFCKFDSDQNLDFIEEFEEAEEILNRKQNHKQSGTSSSIEHHHLSIQLRNERERNRVRAVNEAFSKLRKIIPATANRNKRVSKVKTLQKAVQYIAEMKALLNDSAATTATSAKTLVSTSLHPK